MTTTKANSRILDAVQETAADLHRLSFIDTRKREQLEELCVDTTSANYNVRPKKAQRAE